MCSLYVELVYASTLRRTSTTFDKEHLARYFAGSVDRILTAYTQFVDRLKPYRSLEDWTAKTKAEIKPTNFITDTVEAAMWAFFTSEDFREGAYRVVDLGYGALAGVYYGYDEIPSEWISVLEKPQIIGDIALDLERLMDKVLQQQMYAF